MEQPSNGLASASVAKTRVPLRSKVVLGIGESVQGIYVVIAGFYLNQYLLEVSCLDAGYVGLLQIIGGTFDAFNDPLIGFLSDRTRTRWGRRRPWLLFAAPFLAVSYFCLWSGLPVTAPDHEKFAYFLAFHMLVSVGITCTTVQIGSLVPELTSDYDERSEITAYRLMIGYLVGLVCAVIHQAIVSRVGDQREGYRISGAIFSLVLWLASWVTFAGIREKFEPLQESEASMPVIEQVRAVFKNRAFRCVIGIYLCGPTAVTMVQSNMIMYCKYVLKDDTLHEQLIPLVMGTSWATIPLWYKIGTRIGKRGIYFLGAAILCVSCGSLGFISEGSSGAVYFSTFLAGTSLAVPYFVPMSMLPDVIEDDEIRTGKRREGIFFGFFTVSLKASTTMAMAASNFLLKVAGYRAPVSTCALGGAAGAVAARDGQGPLPGAADFLGVENAIKLLTGVLPALLFFVAIIFAYFYPLTKEKHSELADRSAAARLNRVEAHKLGPCAGGCGPLPERERPPGGGGSETPPKQEVLPGADGGAARPDSAESPSTNDNISESLCTCASATPAVSPSKPCSHEGSGNSPMHRESTLEIPRCPSFESVLSV
mmetsp:Transcript_98198/g.278241  ORF Transcript_98198/g.278241 Transcript_98198/m.278241 type:complete len:596 (+) Transcript_98198:77-1864(+)